MGGKGKGKKGNDDVTKGKGKGKTAKGSGKSNATNAQGAKGRNHDWGCRLCANIVLQQWHDAGWGIPRPTAVKSDILVYGRDMFCQHGHHKSDAHLCEWSRAADLFAKFKPQSKQQDRVPGSQPPQDNKASKMVKENENLRKEVARLRQGRDSNDAAAAIDEIADELNDEAMGIEPKENEAALQARLEQ